MSINPLLAQDTSGDGSLFPVPEGTEAFVLKRDGISFECKLPRGGKLWGGGVFFLSSKRIVFVGTKKTCRQDFKSFAIPLSTLRQPKFEQPIFGANYLAGVAEALPGADAGVLGPGEGAAFSLTFNEGGCGTFLPLFYQLLSEVQQRGGSGQVTQAAQNGRLSQMAYIDPSDPSTLYLTQPAAAPNTEQSTEFQGFDTSAPSAPPLESNEGGQQTQRNQGQGGCVCS